MVIRCFGVNYNWHRSIASTQWTIGSLSVAAVMWLLSISNPLPLARSLFFCLSVMVPKMPSISTTARHTARVHPSLCRTPIVVWHQSVMQETVTLACCSCRSTWSLWVFVVTAVQQSHPQHVKLALHSGICIFWIWFALCHTTLYKLIKLLNEKSEHCNKIIVFAQVKQILLFTHGWAADRTVCRYYSSISLQCVNRSFLEQWN